MLDDFVAIGDSLISKITEFQNNRVEHTSLCKPNLSLKSVRLELVRKPLPEKFGRVIFFVGSDEIRQAD